MSSRTFPQKRKIFEGATDMPKGKYVRRIDNLGRICVPISIRRKLGVMEGGRLEFFLEGSFTGAQTLVTNIQSTNDMTLYDTGAYFI